ncbi:MAG: hypothetical protein KAV83_00025 [Desulfobacterales bacterium]|nr:hypothetical protein [Desulfobacterales bacterium]
MEKENVLLRTNEYVDKYVALKSFKDTTVVAHGTDPKHVMEEASSKGHPSAVLVFVPDNKVSHIY